MAPDARGNKNVDFWQDMVDGLIVKGRKVRGVTTLWGKNHGQNSSINQWYL